MLNTDKPAIVPFPDDLTVMQVDCGTFHTGKGIPSLLCVLALRELFSHLLLFCFQLSCFTLGKCTRLGTATTDNWVRETTRSGKLFPPLVSLLSSALTPLPVPKSCRDSYCSFRVAEQLTPSLPVAFISHSTIETVAPSTHSNRTQRVN